MKTRRGQSGIALLVVLVIVALGTLLATELVRQQQLQTRRGANLLHGDQAFEYALGGETWAKRLLIKDAEDSQHDSLDEFWNQGLPPTPIPGGSISGRLHDLQGRFNLNTLHDGQSPNPEARQRFVRLLSELDLPLELLAAVSDWLDSDSQVTTVGGAEDDYYSRLDQPYRAANDKMVDVTELRLLRGMTEEAYQLLAPLVTVLPAKTTAINMNTAPLQVLQSLGLSQGDAESVIAAREQQPFKQEDDYKQLQAIQNAVARGDMVLNGLAFSSSYFELETEVAMGDLRFVQYSLLHRDSGNKKVSVIDRRRRAW